ncbi:hypothetical protein IWX49DRAFT_172890 [Phyllosticta citricarpa]|uniref:Uncharacterized protein n=1 Tax=Phyllosticta citricarpa TaxID=55181 RepID=A0ABR1M5R6_9PEZI
MPSILGEFTKLCSLPSAWYCQTTLVDNDVAHARNHNGRCQLTCAGPRAVTYFRTQLWSFPPTLNVGDVVRIKVWSSFSRLNLESSHRLLLGYFFSFLFFFFFFPLFPHSPLFARVNLADCSIGKANLVVGAVQFQIKSCHCEVCSNGTTLPNFFVWEKQEFLQLGILRSSRVY